MSRLNDSIRGASCFMGMRPFESRCEKVVNQVNGSTMAARVCLTSSHQQLMSSSPQWLSLGASPVPLLAAWHRTLPLLPPRICNWLKSQETTEG